ncbi:MAG: DUF4340 domain-containing protein [Armatimonadetes bacterium]|nr:DUF4340 domain-containing protein [Armatimonadota bacterium]
MKWRYTVGAGLLFAALLAWVLTQERGRVAREGEIFGLDAKVATKLVVHRKAEKDLVVEKRDGQWYLVSPIEGLADEDEVMRMVKAIAELKPTESRENVDLNSTEFGLADPDLTATMYYGDGKTAQVSLGGETPIGASRFAKVEGRDKLYIVPASIRTTLSREPDKLREKKLAKFETDDVKSIRLQHGTELIAAVRSGEGDKPRWRLTQPLETTGDEWNIKQLINKIKDMKAEDFLKEERSDEELGFDHPQVTVTLTLADGSELTVTVGKQTRRKVGESGTEKDVLFVRSSQRKEILLVKADVLDGLTKSTFDLRDKSVVQVDRDDIVRVKVERKKGLNFSIARRPSGWIVEKPRIADASRSKVDNLLWDIEDLSAKSFVTEKATDKDRRAYGLVVPSTALTIKLRGEESKPIRIFIGDKTDDGDYYCMTNQSDQIVTISKFLVDDLPETEDDLKASATDMTPESPISSDE